VLVGDDRLLAANVIVAAHLPVAATGGGGHRTWAICRYYGRAAGG